uniref:Ig-like domain-containing protein n=1 Tax=Oncorhynchus mykiss TaxID=8022 RepID=A0A8C7UJ45_ONCMY
MLSIFEKKLKLNSLFNTIKNNVFSFAALIQSVRIEMTGEVVSCSSQNIYPAPQVAWNTDPPSGPETLQNSTIKTPDSKGLYTVESTVRILGNVSDHAYFCSVISADKAQVWTVSLRQQVELIGEAGRELSIPCIAPQNLQNFSLTWTFTRTNDPTVILSYDSRTRRTSNLWEGRAGLEQDQVLMGNGSLLLHNPENQEHSGTYTCTFTGLQSRHMVQTQVNITVTPIGRCTFIKLICIYLHMQVTIAQGYSTLTGASWFSVQPGN